MSEKQKTLLLQGVRSDIIKNLSIELKGSHQCAIKLEDRKIVLRKVLEFKVSFDCEVGEIKADMHVSKKYIYLKSTYPLKGIRTCIANDSSFIKRLRMRFFINPSVEFTTKGEQSLLYLFHDIINTCKLATNNPQRVAGYYTHARSLIVENCPSLSKVRITSTTKGTTKAGAWLSDTVRKNHHFSYSGVNMLLSFQAIMLNHPEIFNIGLN